MRNGETADFESASLIAKATLSIVVKSLTISLGHFDRHGKRVVIGSKKFELERNISVTILDISISPTLSHSLISKVSV